MGIVSLTVAGRAVRQGRCNRTANRVAQAHAARPASSGHAWRRERLACQCCAAGSWWRRVPTWLQLWPSIERDRCACSGDLTRRIARSRRGIGWWKVAERLLSCRAAEPRPQSGDRHFALPQHLSWLLRSSSAGVDGSRVRSAGADGRSSQRRKTGPTGIRACSMPAADEEHSRERCAPARAAPVAGRAR